MHLLPALNSAEGDRVQPQTPKIQSSPSLSSSSRTGLDNLSARFWDVKAPHEAEYENIPLTEGKNTGHKAQDHWVNSESPLFSSHSRNYGPLQANTSLETDPLVADQQLDDKTPSSYQYYDFTGLESHVKQRQENPVEREGLRCPDTDYHKQASVMMRGWMSDTQRNHFPPTDVKSDTDQIRD